MGKVDIKKKAAIEKISGYLLENGLNSTGIRALAQAAGTSDRMLIYYFGTKDELLNQVLGSIAAGVTVQLDALLGTDVRSADLLLEELTAVVSQPFFKPAIQLWFELVGLAVRGSEPYLANAKLFSDNWIQWIESRIEAPTAEKATDLYAHLEGRLMIQLIQQPDALQSA